MSTGRGNPPTWDAYERGDSPDRAGSVSTSDGGRHISFGDNDYLGQSPRAATGAKDADDSIYLRRRRCAKDQPMQNKSLACSSRILTARLSQKLSHEPPLGPQRRRRRQLDPKLHALVATRSRLPRGHTPAVVLRLRIRPRPHRRTRRHTLPPARRRGRPRHKRPARLPPAPAPRGLVPRKRHPRRQPRALGPE